MKTSCSSRLRGHLSARTLHISIFAILYSLFTATPVLAGAPADAVPVDVTGRVSVLHADDFEHGKSAYFTYLEDAAKKTKFNLKFEGDMPAGLKTGATIRVQGLAKGKDIYLQADGGTTNVQTIAPAATMVSGDQQTLVIVANFTDATVDCATSAIQDTMFTDPNSKSIDKLYRQTSNQQVSFTGKVAGPFPINVSSTSACDIGAWANAADAQVQSANIDITKYPRRVYVMPTNNSCGYTGVGQVGGSPSQAWIFRCGSPDSFGHELGHNLGMGHAATLTNEYGDVSDIMGAGGIGLRQIDSPHMEQMGWTPSENIQAITQSGNYRLAPLEADPLYVTAPQVLKIAKPDTGEFYYLSYRQWLGFDTSLTSGLIRGVAVHKYPGDYSARKSYLLQTIADGSSFTDATNGITVTQTNHDSSGVNFQVQLSTICTTGKPSLAITPNVQNGAPGTSLSYSVSITDTDLSSCPQSTFSLATTLPAGWGGSISPSTLTLLHGEVGAATLSVASPTSASGGNYGVSVNATDPAIAGHSNTATATYSVTAPCTRNSETLTLTPSNQSSNAGSTLTYIMTMTNNDSSGCGASTLNLSNTTPSGWVGSLSSSSLTLNPGQSGTANLSVTSAANAFAGGYSAAVNASDNTAAVHAASGTVIYSVLGDTQAPVAPVLAGSAVKPSKQWVATLSWNVPSDNVGVTGYGVWRDGVKLGNVTTTSYTDPISTNVTYYYSVKALDAAGNVSAASNLVGVIAQTNTITKGKK